MAAASTDTQNLEVNPMSSADELIGAVRELISLMGKGGISELDLSTGEVTIRLRGQGGAVAARPAPLAIADGSSAGEIPAEDHGHVVTAPMIGTYYSSPGPGEAPFVQIGDEIEIGQVVGIIEAMKIMNEIIADRAGIVLDILVENAQAVEYGSPILRLADQYDSFA